MNTETSRNVLLVEDDAMVASALHLYITKQSEHDFTVSHATTLNIALRKLEDDTIDAIILDLNLPDSKGISTFDAIAKARPKLPILILSGTSDQELAMETVQRGAQDYLVKGQELGTTLMRALRYAIERKRSELEKEQLQSVLHQERRLEALGEITSGVAHEINTPLQFVKANVEFLRLSFEHLRSILDHCEKMCDDSMSDEETLLAMHDLKRALQSSKVDYVKSQLDGAIEETQSGIERIVRIVRAMNVFSRKPHEQVVRYDINRAVTDAILISRGEWKTVASMTPCLCPDLPLIPCYPEDLSQAVLNLIINASHSISQKARDRKRDNQKVRKGAITVTTGLNAEEDHVEILIGDSGSGIPAEIKHRVFEPFFTTKVVGEGSGQGLSYVYNSIVKRHKGQISFDSQEEHGTVFRITLPITPHITGPGRRRSRNITTVKKRKAGAASDTPQRDEE